MSRQAAPVALSETPPPVKRGVPKQAGADGGGFDRVPRHHVRVPAASPRQASCQPLGQAHRPLPPPAQDEQKPHRLPNHLAIATASPLTGGVVGRAYASTFTATGGASPYAWTLPAGSVPGLLLARDGTFSGTPTATGTYTLTVRVTDSLSATEDKPFILIVVATAPDIITASVLAGGTVGTAYSQTLAATGGTTPYTWALGTGALPGGVTLNGAGVLRGVPTNYGTFTFTVELTDTAGLTAIKAFSIRISASALTITSVVPMANAQQGSPYSQALTATGGITPYAWSLAGGSLPPGLTLGSPGDVTGTPTTLGTFDFIYRAHLGQ